MPEPARSHVFRVRELELRYRPHRLDSPCSDQLTEPGAAAKLTVTLLRDCATEVALVLHLNVKHRLIGIHRICGLTELVPISMPEICRAALLSNARSVIFAHNHLSGDPAPSPDDWEAVKRLQNAVRALELDLLDAVIVVDPSEGDRYFSFRQQGLL